MEGPQIQGRLCGMNCLSNKTHLLVKEDHWPVHHVNLAAVKIRVMFQIYTAECLLRFHNPVSVYVGHSSLKRM